MNKRSDRKQQGVTFRVSLVRLLPEPMTCPSCIITQLPQQALQALLVPPLPDQMQAS
jgi:hypothetical protein